MTKTSYEFLTFMGRWQKTEECVCASAPGTMVLFNAKTTEVSFEIEGEARFRFDIDGKEFAYFETNERAIKKIDVLQDGESHQYRLIKISESNPGKICLYNVLLSTAGSFLAPPKLSNRKIEFIGDSFTVGYGNESQNMDDGTPFEKTNASKSYAFIAADGYKANFQINAISGRGLVRNYANIVPEWPLESLYNYTIPGVVEQEQNAEKWNFDSFHPQVIVLFIGINDFQGEPPYADEKKFKKAYIALMDKLRKVHPGVKFLLLSTKTWPNDSMTPAVQQIYDEQIKAGKKDLMFNVVYTENTALHGHPNARSQQELANTIRPLIGRLGGFLSR